MKKQSYSRGGVAKKNGKKQGPRSKSAMTASRMTAGGGSGLGRLQKAGMAKKTKPKKGY